MSFQFIHVDSYGRSAGKSKAHSAAAIIDEAERVPEACPHVERPVPPRVLHGEMPRVALARAEAWAATAKDTKGRKLRKDGNCLAAGVISFPADRIKHWLSFRDEAVKWLEEKYGQRLISVVEHVDESHPHLHFFAVPLPGERFGAVQDGKQAIDDARAQGESRDRQQAAYKEAMRALQDHFFTEVGSRFGLARSGPRRRRLSRKEWKAEQGLLDLLACEDKTKLASAEEKEMLLLEVQQLIERNRQLSSEVLQLGKENLGLRADVRERGRENLGLKTEIQLLGKTVEEFSKQATEKAQESPQAIKKPAGGSLIDALKKSPEKGLKPPSPSSKKPGFSA